MNTHEHSLKISIFSIIMSVFVEADKVKYLFLPGVRPASIISLDKLWKEKVEPVKKTWTVLPKFFYGLDRWVKRCNLRCCSCGLTYNTIPVGMPVRVVRDNDEIGFEVLYNYCGFLCSMRAIIKIPDISVREQRSTMLRIMFEYYYGVKPQMIPTAPGMEEREDYGGNYSEVEFKHIINKQMIELLGKARDKLDNSTFLLN